MQNNNLANGSIYVIDKEYRIRYCNDFVRSAIPDIRMGDYCYRALCGEGSVCKGCQAMPNDGGTGMFYNKRIGVWIEVNSADIDWPGSGPCRLVMTRRIQERNKNLFYNLTNLTTYDELFEINLTRGTYKFVYKKDEKWVTPPDHGDLDSFIDVMIRYLVDPRDKEYFLELWNETFQGRHVHNGESQPFKKGEFRKKRTDGGFCWISQTVVPLTHTETDDVLLMCFIEDIQEWKVKEEESRSPQEPELDSLTGLYRRKFFSQYAQVFMEHKRGQPYCVMAIDIEHFKLFNQWYGQDKGDRFLKRIGYYLQQAADEYDGIAGYMGGDDFCIMMPNNPEMIEKLQKQIACLSREYGENAGFLPAFGLCAIEDNDLLARAIYDRSTLALESVKGKYTKRSSWYDSTMMKRIEEEHFLLAEVQQALNADEFTYYLQPQCNMATGRIVGFESLIRWQHPHRGMISPGKFIPLLEKNGLITNLDIYIWDKVAGGIRSWLDMGLKVPPISVNVSRIDVYTMNIVEHFKSLIQKYNLPPAMLKIEITESAYVEADHLIANAVDGLRTAGFEVLMDDFGSGYSSLNMLKNVNIDVLKLDMKFLAVDEQSIKKGMGILEAIVAMARILGLDLIAEGVETADHVKHLADMGCLYGQGYYFYKPLPIAECQMLLCQKDRMDAAGIRTQRVNRREIKKLLRQMVFRSPA